MTFRAEDEDLFGEPLAKPRKNFSRYNTGKRRAGDYYQTPPSMTAQFLDVLPVKRFPILDPASGSGAISSVLIARYGEKNVTEYDISQSLGMDFLHEAREFRTIITNPPFSLSLQFIEKAFMVATHRISLFLPLDYLHGAERYRKIFKLRGKWALSTIHVYVRKAMLTEHFRKDGLYETGMVAWAWFTWTRSWIRNAPRIHWIDNDSFVLRGK